MRKLILVPLFVSLASAPAFAKDVTITLTDEEQRALTQMLDQAVKFGGLQSAELGVYFSKKLQSAMQQNPVTATPAPKDDK